jgi:hypothetical protein
LHLWLARSRLSIAFLASQQKSDLFFMTYIIFD